jgi:hypothetical protein
MQIKNIQPKNIQLRTFLEKMRINTNQPQNSSLFWLHTMLTDDKRRAMLRALLEQYELPVINMGRLKSQQIRRHRTRQQNLKRVKMAAS